MSNFGTKLKLNNWQPETLYELRQPVIHNGIIYHCIEDHVGLLDFDETKFAVIGGATDPPDLTLQNLDPINTLNQTLDFEDNVEVINTTYSISDSTCTIVLPGTQGFIYGANKKVQLDFITGTGVSGEYTILSGPTSTSITVTHDVMTTSGDVTITFENKTKGTLVYKLSNNLFISYFPAEGSIRVGEFDEVNTIVNWLTPHTNINNYIALEDWNSLKNYVVTLEDDFFAVSSVEDTNTVRTAVFQYNAGAIVNVTGWINANSVGGDYEYETSSAYLGNNRWAVYWTSSNATSDWNDVPKISIFEFDGISTATRLVDTSYSIVTGGAESLYGGWMSHIIPFGDGEKFIFCFSDYENSEIKGKIGQYDGMSGITWLGPSTNSMIDPNVWRYDGYYGFILDNKFYLCLSNADNNVTTNFGFKIYEHTMNLTLTGFETLFSMEADDLLPELGGATSLVKDIYIKKIGNLLIVNSMVSDDDNSKMFVFYINQTPDGLGIYKINFIYYSPIVSATKMHCNFINIIGNYFVVKSYTATHIFNIEYFPGLEGFVLTNSTGSSELDVTSITEETTSIVRNQNEIEANLTVQSFGPIIKRCNISLGNISTINIQNFIDVVSSINFDDSIKIKNIYSPLQISYIPSEKFDILGPSLISSGDNTGLNGMIFPLGDTDYYFNVENYTSAFTTKILLKIGDSFLEKEVENLTLILPDPPNENFQYNDTSLYSVKTCKHPSIEGEYVIAMLYSYGDNTKNGYTVLKKINYNIISETITQNNEEVVYNNSTFVNKSIAITLHKTNTQDVIKAIVYHSSRESGSNGFLFARCYRLGNNEIAPIGAQLTIYPYSNWSFVKVTQAYVENNYAETDIVTFDISVGSSYSLKVLKVGTPFDNILTGVLIDSSNELEIIKQTSAVSMIASLPRVNGKNSNEVTIYIPSNKEMLVYTIENSFTNGKFILRGRYKINDAIFNSTNSYIDNNQVTVRVILPIDKLKHQYWASYTPDTSILIYGGADAGYYESFLKTTKEINLSDNKILKEETQKISFRETPVDSVEIYKDNLKIGTIKKDSYENKLEYKSNYTKNALARKINSSISTNINETVALFANDFDASLAISNNPPGSYVPYWRIINFDLNIAGSVQFYQNISATDFQLVPSLRSRNYVSFLYKNSTGAGGVDKIQFGYGNVTGLTTFNWSVKDYLPTNPSWGVEYATYIVASGVATITLINKDFPYSVNDMISLKIETGDASPKINNYMVTSVSGDNITINTPTSPDSSGRALVNNNSRSPLTSMSKTKSTQVCSNIVSENGILIAYQQSEIIGNYYQLKVAYLKESPNNTNKWMIIDSKISTLSGEKDEIAIWPLNQNSIKSVIFYKDSAQASSFVYSIIEEPEPIVGTYDVAVGSDIATITLTPGHGELLRTDNPVYVRFNTGDGESGDYNVTGSTGDDVITIQLPAIIADGTSGNCEVIILARDFRKTSDVLFTTDIVSNVSIVPTTDDNAVIAFYNETLERAEIHRINFSMGVVNILYSHFIPVLIVDFIKMSISRGPSNFEYYLTITDTSKVSINFVEETREKFNIYSIENVNDGYNKWWIQDINRSYNSSGDYSAERVNKFVIAVDDKFRVYKKEGIEVASKIQFLDNNKAIESTIDISKSANLSKINNIKTIFEDYTTNPEDDILICKQPLTVILNSNLGGVYKPILIKNVSDGSVTIDNNGLELEGVSASKVLLPFETIKLITEGIGWYIT